MIERIVENWLINSTERVFQIPFAQILAARGETVKYISRHGVAEHGKDIVSVDDEGVVRAYQLKTGNLTKSTWQAIKQEVDDLIEIPVDYPGVNPGVQHIPILVTNGTMNADVRLRVQGLNRNAGRRQLMQLRVVTKDELLRMFVDAHGGFLPYEPRDIQRLLQLSLREGRKNLVEEEFASFLESQFTLQTEGIQDARRRITSALLLGKYAVGALERESNHVAVIKAWTIFIAYARWYAEREGVSEAMLGSSIELARHAIETELQDLYDEVVGREGCYLELPVIGDGGLMFKMRMTMVVGYLAVLALSADVSSCTVRGVTELITRNLQHVSLWGEAAVAYIVVIAIALMRLGDAAGAEELIVHTLEQLVNTNEERNRAGLPSPYHLPDALLASYFCIPGREIDLGEFAGGSYMIGTLVDYLVRASRRDLLEPLWERITRVRTFEFVPDRTEDVFLWRCVEGEERSWSFRFPTSWSEMVRGLPNPRCLPEELQGDVWLCALFVLAYPHRMRRDVLAVMQR